MEWSTPCLDSWVGLFDQALSWWNERSDRVMNTIMFCTWEYSWTFRMRQNGCPIQLLVHFWRCHYHDTSKNTPITLNNNNNNSTSILSKICSYALTLHMYHNSNTQFAWWRMRKCHEWCHCCADGLCKTSLAQAICAIVPPSSFFICRAPTSLHPSSWPWLLLPVSKLGAIVVFWAGTASRCWYVAGNDDILILHVVAVMLIS